jgi:hypothetical protein
LLGLGSFLILCTICATYNLFTAQAQTKTPTTKECKTCDDQGRDIAPTRAIDPDPDPYPDPDPDPEPAPPPPECPPCMSDQNPFPGRFGTAGSLSAQAKADFGCNCPAGSHEAGRRVIKVKIDSTWDSSPGNTNANIWNATVCALNKWNTAKDSTGYTSGYFFVIDQSEGTPDVVITRAQASATDPSVRASMDASNVTTRTMRITPGVENLTAASNCGRIAHETGHAIGLRETRFNATTNAWNCVSIMAGANATGTRDYNNVTARDVDNVNKQFNPATRSNCTATIAGQVTEVDKGDNTCVDMDGDGWTVCDGDCNDNDPNLVSNCQTNGCTDMDGDGWCNDTDCDDFDSAVQSCNTYYDPYPYYNPPSYQCYAYYRVTDYYQYSGEGNTWIYLRTETQYMYTECYYSY